MFLSLCLHAHPHPHPWQPPRGSLWLACAIGDLWASGPSCWPCTRQLLKVKGALLRDSRHRMASVQLFPPGVKVVIMLRVWEPIPEKERRQSPTPQAGTHPPLTQLQLRPSLYPWSQSSPWPTDARLAELSGCLGAGSPLLQEHR